MLLVMPSILVRLEEPHLQELRQRFGPLPKAPVLGGAVPPAPAYPSPDEEDVYFDPSQSLDRFVHRCIGTVTELENHRRTGGAVLLAYPDGSLRAVTIDASHDGMSLTARPPDIPPIAQSYFRQRRRGPRFSI
jgi:hypothetical protein